MKQKQATKPDSNVAKLVTVNEAMKRYSFGRSRLMELAKDAHGIVRVGARTIRIDVERMDRFFDALRDDREGE